MKRSRMTLQAAALALVAAAALPRPAGTAPAKAVGGPRILNVADGDVLTGTVLFRVAVPKRPGDPEGQMVLLMAEDAYLRTVAAHAEAGVATIAVDTARFQTPAAQCVIEVRDLRGRTDSRRVRLGNALSNTAHFFSREGLPLQSRRVPDILTNPGGGRPFHSGAPGDYFPANCSSSEEFELSFSARAGGTYRILLTDRAGRPVNVLTASASAESGGASDKDAWPWSVYQIWSGEDERERDAPKGQYQITADLPGGAGFQSLGFVHKVTGAAGPTLGPARAPSSLRFAELREGQRLSGEVLLNVAPGPRPGHVLLLLDGEPVAAVEAEERSKGAVRQRKRVPLPLSTPRFRNGRHVLEARDFHGNSDRRTVVFDNAASEVLYEPEFDRNTAGNGPRVSHLSATLRTAQAWRVELLDGRRRAVRTYRGEGRSIRLAWDGQDDRGRRAPAGEYEIALRLPSGAPRSLGYVSLHTSEE